MKGTCFQQRLFLYQNNKPTEELQLASGSTNEFDQVEDFYVLQISEKQTQIEAFEKKHKDVDVAYEVDLQQLDAMYEVLKEEMRKNSSKEVKDALTLNLLVRINLLNEQLKILEDSKLEVGVDLQERGV